MDDLNNDGAEMPPVITLGIEDEGVDRRIMAEFVAAFRSGLSFANIHEQRSNSNSVQFHAFSQEPVTADEVFRIKVEQSYNESVSGTFSIGFTSCNPAGLKPLQIHNQAAYQPIINNQAIFLENRAGFWKYFTYDLSVGRRVLLKMKSNGEVLMMFGETDYRVLKVDNKDLIWWFVRSDRGVKYIEVLTTRCDYDYLEIERSLRKNGLASGLPITPTGELDRDFKHVGMAEFQKINWDSDKPLILYDNLPIIRNLDPMSGGFTMKPDSECEKDFYGFSYERIEVGQIIQIIWITLNEMPYVCSNVQRNSHEHNISVGFTNRHPGSVDLPSLKVATQGVQGRQDYWVFTNVNINEASRVLMKINSGEVWMLVGDDDWRKLNVDMTSPLWLFFYVPGSIKQIYCRYYSTVKHPANFKRSPESVFGLTPGVPVTVNGEPDNELANRSMSEIQNINWNQIELLTTFEMGYYWRHIPFHIFSKKPAKIEQVYEVVVHKSNLQNDLYLGFTNRDPVSLDWSHLPNPAAAGFWDRADYWIFTKFDITVGSRVLVKIRNGGEVLVMFGEQDLRLLKVDFSEPLWLFVYTRDETKHVTVLTVEKPLRKITGYVDGVPLKCGRQDIRTIDRVKKEFRTMDFDQKVPLEMYQYRSLKFPQSHMAFQVVNGVVTEYVFSLDCVQLNRCHRIIVKASKKQLLHVGFTSRDPAGLDIVSMPNPAALGDRADYWIYTSFELGVGISRVHVKLLRGGEVMMWQGIDDCRVFKVDTTRPLWLFLNGKGISMQCFYTIATRADPESEHEDTSDSESETSTPPNLINSKKHKECVICKDRTIDSVILNCGHVCCCFDCAVSTKERSESCPVCRQSITDINRVYFS